MLFISINLYTFNMCVWIRYINYTIKRSNFATSLNVCSRVNKFAKFGKEFVCFFPFYATLKATFGHQVALIILVKSNAY